VRLVVSATGRGECAVTLGADSFRQGQVVRSLLSPYRAR